MANLFWRHLLTKHSLFRYMIWGKTVEEGRLKMPLYLFLNCLAKLYLSLLLTSRTQLRRRRRRKCIAKNEVENCYCWYPRSDLEQLTSHPKCVPYKMKNCRGRATLIAIVYKTNRIPEEFSKNRSNQDHWKQDMVWNLNLLIFVKIISSMPLTK